MKYFLVFILFFISIQLSYCTEYSKFAAKEYSKTYNLDNATITVKKEHIEEYAQEFNGEIIPYIAYGYGDLKSKQFRKQRITYLCLINKELKPIWYCVYKSN